MAEWLLGAQTCTMRTESTDHSYLALPDGAGPHPGVVVVHEAFGLNDNIRDICRRFADEGMPRWPSTCSRGATGRCA